MHQGKSLRSSRGHFATLIPARFRRLSVKTKRRMSATSRYRLSSLKRLARERVCVTRGPDQDARDAAGFMPRGASARVLNWPVL